MKIAVIYRSMTGHSKKIAKAVSAALGTEALDIKKKPVLEGVDLVFIAGGIYGGKSLNGMIDYIKTLSPSNAKSAVLLTSSASDKTGQNEVREILTLSGISVSEKEYRCKGGFLLFKFGHPDKNEIAAAAEFAKTFL